MPTQLPPINQSLLSGLQQARTEQISSLTRLLDVAMGSTVMALIEKVAPISAAQRDFLLTQQQQSLTTLAQQPPSSAVKTQINILQEQQTLLTSPLLKLVQLVINGRNLLTFTDQPLQQGQQIPVKVDAQQRLVQLLAPKNLIDQPKNNVTSPLNTSAITTEKTAPSAIENATRIKTEQVLAEVLRSLLPQKDKPQELFSALPHIFKLPDARKQQLLSTTVQIALKRIAEQLRAPEQLMNPKTLSASLKNSGVHFEHKLAAQFLPKQLADGPQAKSPITKVSVNSPAATQLSSQDIKGSLLHLLHRVNQELAREHPQLAITNPASTTSKVSTDSIPAVGPAQISLLNNEFPPPTFHQLLQQMSQPSRGELSDKVLRTQLLLLLHQHTLTGLAKVQLQQLHAVNHQQSQIDNPQPTQSWIFEIPIKHGQDFNSINLRIDQEWVDEESNGSNTNDKKVKQWSVMLSFNLPTLGSFHTQLTVVHESVSAKMWAEHETALSHAKQKLSRLREQLQAQGIEVKQLECIQGTPPSKTISLRYALVDITT